MKNHIFLAFSILVLTGFCFNAFAQSKNIPPPDKDIAFDKEPTLVKRVEPVYPASMLRGGWEATVYMKAFIDVDGSVVEAKSEKVKLIAHKSDDKDDEYTGQGIDGKAFIDAANDALKQWKFSPAQIQGKPVAVWVTIPFRFKLSSKETKPEEEADNADMEKKMESIKTTVENILQGTELEKAKKSVAKGALLIYNTKAVDLNSVLNGEHKDIHLTEEKDAKSSIKFNIKITDGGKSALIVCNSELANGKNKHVHSIFLSKTAENTWKIAHWHVSF